MRIEKRYPSPRLGRGGYLLDIPENKDFTRRLRATQSLAPAELIRLSKAYRRHPALTSLADHLFANAVRKVAATRPLQSRVGLAVDPADEAFWRELESAEEGLEPENELTPSDEPPDPEFPGLPDQAPVDICEFKCTWWTVFFIGTGLLWEDCGDGWHVIGACLSS
jgi:hypothetical protein